MNPLFASLEQYSDIPIWLLSIVLIWSMIWKGIALYKAAQKKSIGWFVALLIINTVGIFEILYIFLFSEMKFDDIKSETKKGKIKSKKLSSKKKIVSSDKGFFDN